MNLEAYLKDYLGAIPKADGRPGKRFYRICCSGSCNYDGDAFRQIFIYADGSREGGWKCWRCEKGGDFVKLISHLEGITWKQAKKKAELYESFYGSDPEEDFKELTRTQPKHDPEEPKYDVREHQILEGIETIKKNSNAAVYLKRRGFGKREIRDWELGWCSSGRLKDRIVIPVRSPDGKWIRAWQGRAIDSRKRPTYLATSETEGTNIKHLLLNLHRAVDPLVIVEGYFDAMAVGNRNAVGLLGKGITEQQMELLRERRPKRVIVPLDGDALLEADRIASDLRCFTDARFVQLPYSQDPCSMGRNGFWEFLDR